MACSTFKVIQQSYAPFYYGRPIEQGRPLYFHPVVSSFSIYIFFSSSNLSRRRLDVCHTTTRGVALARI